MLLSMTGFGEAHCQRGGLAVSVEVRAVNSRYFKLSVRTSEGYGGLEPQIEAVVRRQIRRGTVQVSVHVNRTKSPEDYKINIQVLEGYRRQLEPICGKWHPSQPMPLDSLLLLPGVVDENAAGSFSAADDWPVVGETLQTALDRLHQMRVEEGRAMAAELGANCRALAISLDEVERRAPLVAEVYRKRLEERVNCALADFNLTLDPADVLKEVGLFAERSDITEEIVRFRSHLEQFQATMDSPESSGRKLEFLTQEMVREANTIGSKANDVEIARQVIEIKASVERIREMIQNVE